MRQAEKHAIVADRVFDGTAVVDNAAIIIEGPRILAVVPQDAAPANMPPTPVPALEPADAREPPAPALVPPPAL